MKMKDWPEGMSREDAKLFRRGLRWISRELGHPEFYGNLKAEMEDDSLSPKQRHPLGFTLSRHEAVDHRPQVPAEDRRGDHSAEQTMPP